MDEGLPLKWAEINATTAGDTEVVAAVAGRRIRVIGMDLIVSSSVSVAWKSGDRILRNAQAILANGGIVVQVPRGWYIQTHVNQALVINLSGASNVRGGVVYHEAL